MAATTRTPVAGPTAAMATVATVIEQNFTLIQLLGSQGQQLHDTMLVLFMCTKPFIICHISVRIILFFGLAINVLVMTSFFFLSNNSPYLYLV